MGKTTRTRGPAFKAWTADAMNCRFRRLKESKGIECCAYIPRHSWATRKPVEGHDHPTVAELMGRASGATLAAVYSHIDKQEEHLKKALESETSERIRAAMTGRICRLPDNQ